jgi:hypothetical protein
MDLHTTLGDYRGAGYGEATAARLAARVTELVRRGLREIDEPTLSDRNALHAEALEIATHEIPPDVEPS